MEPCSIASLAIVITKDLHQTTQTYILKPFGGGAFGWWNRKE